MTRRKGQSSPDPSCALPPHDPDGSRRPLGPADRRAAVLGPVPRRARPGECLARPTGSACPSCPPGLAPTPGSPRLRFRSAETRVRGSG